MDILPKSVMGIDAKPVPLSALPLSDAQLQIAQYRGFYDPIPIAQPTLSFASLIKLVLNAGRPFLTDDKAHGPYFTGPMRSAPFIGKTLEKMKAKGLVGDDLIGVQRSANHSLGGQVLKFDLDDVAKDEFKKIIAKVRESGLAFISYTTFKHGVEEGVMRVRLIVLADRLMPPKEFALVSEYVGLQLLSRSYDKSEHYAYQPAGVWMCPPEREHQAGHEVRLGAMIDVEGVLGGLPREKVATVDERSVAANDALDSNQPFRISRNKTALESAINALDFNEESENWRWVLKANKGAREGLVIPPPTQEELDWLWDTSMEWASQYENFSLEEQFSKMTSQQAAHPRALFRIAAGRGWQNPGTDREENELNFGKQDVANARGFASHHAEDLRYVHAEKTWFHWNGVIWERCGRNQQVELAKAFSDWLYSQIPVARKKAEDAGRDGDAAAKVATKHCVYTSTKKGMDAMLALAQSDPRIGLDSLDDFDADPWLFQCANGTLDLRSGKLLAPDPNRLITRSSPVALLSGATCPTWVKFLSDIFPDDPETIESVQRWMGYTLSGVVSEEVLFVELGCGANGKSVRDAIHRHVLGSYARAVSPTLITSAAEEDGSKASPELVSLCGLRYGSINETRANDRLNETGVKRIAGSERIVARQLYGKSFEFAPSAKCAVRTNHRPVVTGTDEGIWRRLVLVRYPRHFKEEERDLGLTHKLIAESEGILAWMVDGFRKWQRDGLKLSPRIRGEMAAYREESDLFGEFLSDNCEFGPKERVLERTLYHLRYVTWCHENGVRAMSKKRFTGALAERGVDQGVVSEGRCYLGLRLKDWGC